MAQSSEPELPRNTRSDSGFATLTERCAEEAQQQEEREKTEAFCMVAGEIIKDNWEAANKRRLEHQEIVLIQAQKHVVEDLA